MAVALHPELDYCLAKSSKGHLIFAETLGGVLKEKFLGEYEVVKRFKGKELEGKTAEHPFLGRGSKVVLADYVSSLDGSGCVHIAPGHGEEDFNIGKKYGLDIVMPLDNKGFFKDVGDYSGINVRDVNPKVIEKMKGLNTLLLDEKIKYFLRQ